MELICSIEKIVKVVKNVAENLDPSRKAEFGSPLPLDFGILIRWFFSIYI